MKLPTRTARFELAGDYAGIWVDIEMNSPMRAFEDLSSGDWTRMYAALARIVRASNLTDEEDRPLDLSDALTWPDLPLGFVTTVAAAITEAMKPSSGAEPARAKRVG